MEDLLQNDLFHLVFGVLAAIFLLAALVNALRSRVRNNRRETSSIIKSNGDTGNERAPVRLENPFAVQEPAVAAPKPAQPPAQTPVPAPAPVVAADKPTGQSLKAPAADDEVYEWR